MTFICQHPAEAVNEAATFRSHIKDSCDRGGQVLAATMPTWWRHKVPPPVHARLLQILRAWISIFHAFDGPSPKHRRHNHRQPRLLGERGSIACDSPRWSVERNAVPPAPSPFNYLTKYSRQGM